MSCDMCIVELYLGREFIRITKPYHSTDTMQLVSQVFKGKCQELEHEIREEDVRHREKEARGGWGGGGVVVWSGGRSGSKPYV